MDLSKLRKMESPAPRQLASGVEGTVAAMFKVGKAGYRPKGVTVRAEISAAMFTAEFPAEALATLENDPLVESISLPRAIQMEAK